MPETGLRKPQPPSPTSLATQSELLTLLGSQWERLNTLYYVRDKYGEKVLFRPWPEQAELYRQMHYLNLVLKARQRGLTTIIQLFMLDCCLFNDNVTAGVIAHTREDAQKFFASKIKFAYDNLPDTIKALVEAKNDNTNELSFSNGSSIRVGTSLRSDTLQYLHVSEYGKICARMPEKAQEIRAGGLNTVAPGNIIFIESTAEGAYGDFYEKSKRAENLHTSSTNLSAMDYKFFFFPWWRAPEYVLADPVTITVEQTRYFEELADQGIKLTSQQMYWYVKKSEEQGDSMLQEYPSTPEEAFRGVVDGAAFGKQMARVRRERRIMRIPHDPRVPVNTFWDIGRDMTCIWFHQRVGAENRFIQYHQEQGQNLAHFVNLLLQGKFRDYTYGSHYFPHDMGNIDFSQSDQLTRKEVAENLGLKNIEVVPRVLHKEDSIEMGRQALATSYFDEKGCEAGIKGLENYCYKWDPKLEVYTRDPIHNAASHPADAYQQFAMGYRFRPYSPTEAKDNPLSRSYRKREKRVDETDWRI